MFVLLLPSSFFPQVSGFRGVVYFCALQVLWPYLLECLVPEPFTFAMSSLCRCIDHIAAKKREEQAEDFAIDFEVKSKCLFDRNSFRLLRLKKAVILNKRTLTSFCFYHHNKGQEHPVHHILFKKVTSYPVVSQLIIFAFVLTNLLHTRKELLPAFLSCILTFILNDTESILSRLESNQFDNNPGS